MKLPATAITSSSTIDNYGWFAFLAALAENGVDVRPYFYKNNTTTNYGANEDAEGALKTYLTISTAD